MSGAVIQQTRVIQVDARGNSLFNVTNIELSKNQACDIDLYTNNIIDFAKDGIVDKNSFQFLTHSTGNLQNMSPAKASGILFNEKLSTDFEKLWEVKTGDVENPKPIVYKDRMFVMGDDKKIHALSTKNGEEIWSFKDKNGDHLHLSHKDGVVYASTEHGLVYFLDAKDGNKIFELKTDVDVDSPPVVKNDILYLIDNSDGKISAFNMKNKNESWSFSLEGSMDLPFVLHDGILFIARHNGSLYALNEIDGQKRWSCNIGGHIETPPVVSGNMVYIKSLKGDVYALDSKNGNKIWSCFAGKNTAFELLIEGNTVYITGGADNKLYAFNANNGKELWSFEAQDVVCATPCYNDGMVYVGSFDHNLYALDAESGNELWKFQTNGKLVSSPVYDNGVIYFVSLDHNLYALDSKTGTELGIFKINDKNRASPVVHEGAVYFMTKNEENYSPVVINGVLCSGGYDYRVYALKGKVGMSKIIKEASEASNDITAQQESPKIDIGNEWAVIGDTKVQINK